MSEPRIRRTGFTVPGGAAAAARKNHELGTAHQFTSQSAREARQERERRREASRNGVPASR